MPSQSRRDFLRLMSALAAAGLSGVFSPAGARRLIANSEVKEKYTVLPWAGDDFTFGHRLRDGEIPKMPDKAERKVDFVIVGGGMAGLACAHYLKGEDVLLLEQYQNTGGTSSGGSYRGIDYSMGAVCTGSHEGIFGQLFSDLEIKPAVIPPEQVAWHCNNIWYTGKSETDSFYSELNRLTKELKSISEKLESSPAEERDALGSKLNSTTFDKYLAGYDRHFVGLINNICRSFFCADPSYVTAMAGVWMMRALSTDSYVFPGGNSGIARALRRSFDAKSPDRCQTSCFVWLVEKKGDGASVVYSDRKGEMHRVDCRHAVLAVPPLVALRIARGLPEKMKENMQKLEYGAFLVANFCMNKKVFRNPYQSFADEPFPFSQMVLAEAPYEKLGTYKAEMGSVLTVYHPFEHGPAGRALLLEKDRDELADSLVEQLVRLVEGFRNNLEEVVLTRWGHAMIVPKPGLSGLMSGMQGLDPGWMTFAHSSSKGGPSMEGAVLAGRFAADRCLSQKTHA